MASGWATTRRASLGRVASTRSSTSTRSARCCSRCIQIFDPGVPLFGLGQADALQPARTSVRDAHAQGPRSWWRRAGPISNLILARALHRRPVRRASGSLVRGATRPVLLLLAPASQINVALAVFNLIPMPPLDGSQGRRPSACRGRSASAYDRVVRPYGSWILLLLFVTGVLSRLRRPLIAVPARSSLGLLCEP